MKATRFSKPTPAIGRRLRRKRRKDQRGIALILVLGSITLLTVFLTQLQEETSAELSSAIAERDALKAEYYARSAVNLSRLLIAMEPLIVETVKPIFAMLGQKGVPQIPVWEFTDLVLGPFNDSVGSQSFLATIGGDAQSAKNIGIQGGGRFEVTIVDEDAKVNLNIAARNDPASSDRIGQQLLGIFSPPANNSLFEQHDADNQFSDRQTICGALVDWADSDPSGNEGLYACQPLNANAVAGGAEDNFYQVIGLPYRRKNAAYDSMEEARLVRGMGDDFWATFVDPEPQNPKKRVLTVWGQGELNVNAANAQTLLALACGAAPDSELCIDPMQQLSFLSLVSMVKGFTMGMPLFGKPADFVDLIQGKGQFGGFLSMVNLKPVTVNSSRAKELTKMLAVKSKRFSIYADGIVPGYKRTTKVRIHAVVDFRDAGKIGPAGSVIVGGANMAAQAMSAQASQQAAGLAQNGKSSGSGSAPALEPGSADAILAQLNSNPAGTVIYWRVE